ncbi:alpha-amylase family glycosyl hydrolase [Roseateles sp.]|uniref:alpha-amylase family glycosyl hydrolase n=1 Tax=Roseateles sp. TaxID=1971397 RepID=UPI003D111676
MRQADWWRGATLYQIYPRSFADSNGDGIGDLRGITERLDYVASLGVDGIWLSPFFASPMRDFGYDVSDYREVDPMFGTLEDFDALVDRAHALSLKVVIDQVWSHTAIEHPWFEESRQSRDNPKADWYVWADAKPDGSPPSNWQSWMGCPTWTWEPRRKQYYLHNFLPQMPDLNFHNAEVQDAILAVGRFWLERGVDGFRLDTANYYCHDPQLRDNPPQPPERRGDIPAAMQQHLFNVCQPQNLPFLERVRALTDEFDARFTVAEIGSANNLERMIEYTSGTQRLHTAYSFVLLGALPKADALLALVTPWLQGEGAQAWPSWAMSNHDAPRVATRWAQGDEGRIQQLLALLIALRGTIFIYQGEELGLTQSDIAFDQLQDPYGKAHWPRDKGRDGCRTPMPWASAVANAGFSLSDSTWLPVDPAHQARAVDVQEADDSSCLNFTRRLLALRRAHPALRQGSFEPLWADEQVLVVLRREGADAVLLAFNLSDTSRTVELDQGFLVTSEALVVGDVQMGGSSLQLAPWAALVSPVELSS